MNKDTGIDIERITQATDDVRLLIGELDQTLAAEYLPEQRHGLALEALFRPQIRFFLARLNGVAVGCGGSAHSGNTTFKLTDQAGFSITVKFYSETRSWVWPSATTHWTLGDTAQHAFSLTCKNGEKICYGGAFAANDQTYWGVGFQGNKSCKDCCLICGNNVSHAWNLTPAPSNTWAHCNDGSCQCGFGTPGGPCASHGGNNPTLGCTQQQ